MRRLVAVLILTVSLAGADGPRPARAQGAVEIAFWYGVGGQLQNVIESQAEKFNHTHPGITVDPFGELDLAGPRIVLTVGADAVITDRPDLALDLRRQLVHGA